MIDQSDTHVFIVRVWREPGTSSSEAEWRGVIEIVASGERHYFADVDDVSRIIHPYVRGEASSRD